MRGKVSNAGQARIQQTTVFPKGEIGGVFGETADGGCPGVLHLRNGAQRLPSSRVTGQMVRRQVTLELVRNVVPCSKVKRGVGNREIKGVREANARVVNLPDVGTELEAMTSVNPG